MNGWRYLYRLQRLVALRTSDQITGTVTPPEIAADDSTTPLPTSRILRTWLPLAATWILMTGEGPLLAAAIARQVNPELNLAAWSVVFPIVLILGAPGLTLLSVSTSLVRDMDSYYQIRRFVFWLIGIITGLHVLLAFTPLFDFAMHRIIGLPQELLEPVRLGFQIMIPFTSALAYRRFCNGVLIRFERTNAITVGAVVRLTTNGITLLVAWLLGFSGIAMATAGITMSVFAEFLYATLVTRSILETKLRPAPKVVERLTLRSFAGFYVPLVLTTLIYIFLQPMIAAALSRMPDPISSLAGWPVLYGIVMLVSGSAFAFTEVVVVMLDEPNAQRSLTRFTAGMAICMVALLVVFNVTSLADVWLKDVAALPPDLIPAVRSVLWFAIPLPAFTAADSLFTGALMKSRRTRAVTEAALISISTVAIVLTFGVIMNDYSGLMVGITATLLGGTMRTLWLARRSQPVLQFSSQ